MTSLAEPKDLPGIVTLLAEANLCHDDLRADHLSDFIVIEEDDELIGSVGLEVFGRHALLRSLIVSPARRGDGIGHHLVEAIETHARLTDVSALYLLTTTANRFFERLGYKEIGRDSVPHDIAKTTEFASFCPDTAVCMRKELG